MIHAPLLYRRPQPAPCLQTEPLYPAAYLRLRRQAAGRTVDQVAEIIAPRASDRSEATALIYLLETRGAVARHDSTLATLQRAFPFDPDVYRQLATEPADRHPRICRVCGCSEWDPCIRDGEILCAWSAPDRCSTCPTGEAA